MSMISIKKILAGGLLALAMSSTMTGCLTDDKKDPVPPNDPTVSEKTLTAGAQSNADWGSLLDIDSMFDWKMDEVDGANTDADMDLVFAYSTSAGFAAIYSPIVAKDGLTPGTGFTFLATLSPANTTTIKTVTGVTWANITKKSQVDSLYAAGTAVANGRLQIANGTTFVAQSNKGTNVLIQATSTPPVDGTGTEDFKGKAKF